MVSSSNNCKHSQYIFLFLKVETPQSRKDSASAIDDICISEPSINSLAITKLALAASLSLYRGMCSPKLG